MVDNIRVLIVDDVATAREYVAKLLSIETDMQVIGVAGSGREAIDQVARLGPDIVLLDINMPDMDGIEATERISARSPGTAIIMMSIQGDADYVRRSMLAGARGFVVKPFSAEELVDAVRRVYGHDRERRGQMVPVGPGAGQAAERHRGRVVAVFSPKGGVGRTTIAVNLAVAAGRLHEKVVVVDANVQFGDVGLLLDLKPSSPSIGDALADIAEGQVDVIDTVLIKHSVGIDALLAPPNPETAELVALDHYRASLEHLRQTHQLVIVDCDSSLRDTTLAILDLADVVLCVMSLDLTSIKSTRLFIAVADRIGYGPDKLRIVINRADSPHGITLEEVERSLGRKVDFSIVSDGRSALHALNNGVPFAAGNQRAQITQDIEQIAAALFPRESELLALPQAKQPKQAPRLLSFSRR